jgi:chromosome segregation ATPase
MHALVLGVALLGVITDASHLHRRKDEVASSEDAGSANAAGVEDDSVVELRQQLQESQQEDDTNEAIIESLLGKQQRLANTTVTLQKELGEVKRKAAATPPPMDPNEKSQMQKEIAMLQAKVGDLTAKLSSSEKKETQEEGLVATMKLQNKQFERRNLQLLNESKTQSKEGHLLRQSLTRTKLALLQSMNAGTATKSSDGGSDAGGGGAGALMSSSEVRSLSEKLFSASEALNSQVGTLNKKLKKETEINKKQKVKIQDLQAENVKLKSKAESKSDEKKSLEQSYAEMDSELAQTLHNLRHEEKALRQGALQTAKATDAQVDELQAENARLKTAGQEVMQKYDMLAKAYQREHAQMSFIEAKDAATKKSTKKVASTKPLAHRAPRVFLERSSHYGAPHWRPSAARAFAALRHHEMMLLQQKTTPAKATPASKEHTVPKTVKPALVTKKVNVKTTPKHRK